MNDSTNLKQLRQAQRQLQRAEKMGRYSPLAPRISTFSTSAVNLTRVRESRMRGEDFSVKVSVVADRNLQNIPFQLLENPSVGNAYFEKLLSRAWAYRIVAKKER